MIVKLWCLRLPSYSIKQCSLHYTDFNSVFVSFNLTTLITNDYGDDDDDDDVVHALAISKFHFWYEERNKSARTKVPVKRFTKLKTIVRARAHSSFTCIAEEIAHCVR